MARLGVHAAVGALVSGGAVVVHRGLGGDPGAPEWLFGAVLVTAFSLALGLVLNERSTAGRAQADADQLTGVPLHETALEAVREERRRLTEDITDQLRCSLDAVSRAARTAVAAARSSPVDTQVLAGTVAGIQGHTQHVTGELRRQLGLVRQEEADLRGEPAPPSPSPRPTRTDVVVATVVTVLAGVESVAYPLIEGRGVVLTTTAVTAVTASLVLWRTVAPGAAAAALAGFHVLGVLLDRQVLGGFWCLATVGGLLWAVGAGGPLAGLRLRRLRVPPLLLAPVVLVAVGLSSWLGRGEGGDPEILTAIGVTGWAGGLAVGRARRRAGEARARSVAREREVQAARQVAVQAERLAFAREIHDVVSHAVGVVAVQTSAAQVLLATEPLRAVDSLAVVADTARSALAELDRLQPTDVGARVVRSREHVEALAERIRAAGTPVELHLHSWSGEHGEVVYRVVQESLTNVVRHGHGASASVEVDPSGEALRVCVTDDGGPVEPAGPSRGYGLIGLGERVAALGGTLSAGPDPSGGGFRVEVRLRRPAAVALEEAGGR